MLKIDRSVLLEAATEVSFATYVPTCGRFGGGLIGKPTPTACCSPLVSMMKLINTRQRKGEQEIKLCTFEEFVTRAHDMELSIANRGQLLENHFIQLPECERSKQPGNVDDPNYCKYHRVISHPVEKYFVLKELILKLAREKKIELDIDESSALRRVASAIDLFILLRSSSIVASPLRSFAFHQLSASRFTLPKPRAISLQPCNILTRAAPMRESRVVYCRADSLRFEPHVGHLFSASRFLPPAEPNPLAKSLFVILVGSKYCFTPEITSYSLRPTDPLLNNWFKVQPINMNPSRANEKVGPLVQDLNSVLKETTYLLSQKRVGVNSVLHPMSLAIHLGLSLKWEAYWASDDELPSPMEI
ncbi:ty3-gypsy retrotransposon protein [Cucumis melo var. makuwa]|uniref:Ty3-gypsy retrotransposon protein n=1 Tax=Cucumis melo var. makuwa TaxID=1194695 RepID=A0A5D3BKC3_CUCMM|nr:ty3-gypsy retrotransposon protein [Cucumis melo var. makuwa]